MSSHDVWYVTRTIFKPRPRVKNYIYRGREKDTLLVRTLFLSDDLDAHLGERILCRRFGMYLLERQSHFSKETVQVMNSIIYQDVDREKTLHQKIAKEG